MISYHSFSDNDINYKPSIKYVQSLHVIRFLTKKRMCTKWPFCSTGGVKCLPVLQSNLFYTFISKSEYRQF